MRNGGAADTEEAVDGAVAVSGDARPRIDRIRLRTVVDWIVDGKAGAVVAGDGDSLSRIGMEIVVGDEDIRAVQRKPRLIRVLAEAAMLIGAPPPV